MDATEAMEAMEAMEAGAAMAVTEATMANRVVTEATMGVTTLSAGGRKMARPLAVRQRN